KFGWDFKQRRARDLLSRTDEYKMHILIGEGAFLWLRELTAEGRRAQLERLREFNDRPCWELRVMVKPHLLGGNFGLYLPNGNTTAGPPFVFAEIQDRSWCLEE